MPAWTGIALLLAACMAIAGAWAATRSRLFAALLLGLALVHCALAAAGFYHDATHLPPRPVFLLGPAVLALGAVLALPRGRSWLAQADLFWLTALHTMRLPVELVLHSAGAHGLVPVMMTWSGTNLDVLTGLSAPAMALYLRRATLPRRELLLAWNVAGLLLALNVVTTAVLSLPGPLNVLNAAQPNVLVLSVPHVLLPAVIVPVAFWAHAAALVKLARG
jgi:hypothetical protein